MNKSILNVALLAMMFTAACSASGESNGEAGTSATDTFTKLVAGKTATDESGMTVEFSADGKQATWGLTTEVHNLVSATANSAEYKGTEPTPASVLKFTEMTATGGKMQQLIDGEDSTGVVVITLS